MLRFARNDTNSCFVPLVLFVTAGEDSLQGDLGIVEMREMPTRWTDGFISSTSQSPRIPLRKTLSCQMEYLHSVAALLRQSHRCDPLSKRTILRCAPLQKAGRKKELAPILKTRHKAGKESEERRLREPAGSLAET